VQNFAAVVAVVCVSVMVVTAHDNTRCLTTLNQFRVILLHGRQRHWNIGRSQVERRRRENRGAVGCEGVGSREGLCPFPENL